jgi:integrase/recombinase XerD
MSSAPAIRLVPTRHPAAVYLAGLAPGSRRTMAAALDVCATLASGGRASAATFDWRTVDYAVAIAIRTALLDRYAPRTVNRHLAALRGVLRAARRLGLMPVEQAIAAAEVHGVREPDELAGHALAPAELATLLASVAADLSLRGRRDQVLLGVLVAGGLRRAEAAGLDRTDVDGDVLAVTGKGGKLRRVPLPAGTAAALRTWCVLSDHLAVPQVFVRITRTDALTRYPLSTRGVAKIVARRAAAAGVPPCAPHDLRRTYTSMLLERGADVLVVASLLGHANPRTTARYDRRGLDAKRRAAALLDVPSTEVP